ncbi:ABC transporter permease [Selenihalanaerobacter shriftii]|uniref:Molybdate/tungstate transport system permease protein n=1 Tax=Selenihalanaerobacter shriftii TaxID=142842 RepID=A0A1T4PCW3_9FIRM|nr:ABC transporter permease [Selenihalanaerobacter shriftii]SJZ89352.1 molybdate/tungstate transport system permease protein [Selenihalanaerobacter shriftii]
MNREKSLFEMVFYFLAVIALSFISLPLLNLILRGLSLDILTNILTSDFYNAIRVSLIASLITLVINILWGIPVAYLLARREFIGKKIVQALIFFPIVIPPIVSGILLLMLFGPRTIIGGVLVSYGLRFTGTIWGTILAQTFITAPYLIITTKVAFEKVDKKLEDISLLLGKSQRQTFWQITLPLAKDGIIAGILLTWIRAIGEFGATIILAYHPYSLPIRIWVQFTSGGLKTALPLVIGLILIVVLILIILRLIIGELKLKVL